jgi:hypothetical protein
MLFSVTVVQKELFIMYRYFAWSVVVLFPLCLLAGCGSDAGPGTPTTNVKSTQPEKGKKESTKEPGAGKNAATIND